MLTPTAGAVGLGRALLWSSVVLALALTAHLEAGGHLPPAEGIIALGALLLAVTAAAVRRQIRWPGGLALAGLGQYGLHQAFSFLGGTCAPAPLVDGGVHAAHLADGGVLAGQVTGSLAHGACAGSAHGAVTPGMLAWHVLATGVSVALLVGVERGVWVLASWLARPLSVRPLRLVVARHVPVLVTLETPVGSVDVHVAPVRGPPSSVRLMHLAA